MKKISCILVLIMLVGCYGVSEESPKTIFIVYMFGAMGDSLLYDIKNDRRVELTVGDFGIDIDNIDLTQNNDYTIFKGPNTKSKAIILSSKEYSQICELISQLSDEHNDKDKINRAADACEVFAVIEDKIYWSNYNKVTNKTLLELAELLLQMTDMQFPLNLPVCKR